MKNCTKCGAQNEDNDKFCGSCGETLDQDAPTEAAPAEAQSAPAENAAPTTGAKGKIVSTRNKALGFEKKHSIIANAIIAVCAIVIMFVALFAPIKVMAYEVGGVQDDAETGHYVEVDQTVWDMFGAIGYISLDSNNPADVLKKVEIETEYRNALIGAITPEMAADNLSGINYIAYLLAHNSGAGFSDLFVSPGGGSAFISLVFGLVVTLLSLIMAIISLVYLIFAIIGVVKKQTTKNPFKYLSMMIGLSISAVAVTAIMPLGKAGGATAAIFVFAAVMMLVLGACYSLVMGKAGLAQVIKKSAISLVMLIGICLLFTNAVMDTAGRRTANVPFGYGLYNIFASIAGGGENMAAMSAAIGGAVIAAFSASVIAGAGKALNSYLKSLAELNDGKTNNDKVAFTNSIMAIIMGVVAIVFAFVGAPLISKSMTQMPVMPDPTMLFRAQMYVTLVFLLAAAIVMKAFKPKDNKFLDEPALETANGAPQAADEQTPASVEDVKEPEVEEKPANDDLSEL